MDIIRLHVSGSYMHVYQRLRVGRVPIFIQIVQDTTGNPLQAQTDKLLNKILYYDAEQGLGYSPASLAWSSNAEYFANDIKGTICRLGANGIIVISLYKANAFFTDKLQYFRTDLNNGYSVPDGNPQVLGVFDPYTNKYIVALEEINRYSATPPNPLVFHQDGYTIAFTSMVSGLVVSFELIVISTTSLKLVSTISWSTFCKISIVIVNGLITTAIALTGTVTSAPIHNLPVGGIDNVTSNVYSVTTFNFIGLLFKIVITFLGSNGIWLVVNTAKKENPLVVSVLL